MSDILLLLVTLLISFRAHSEYLAMQWFIILQMQPELQEDRIVDICKEAVLANLYTY